MMTATNRKKLKTIGLYQIREIKALYEIENSTAAEKLQALQALQFYKNNIGRITIGCWRCTYPSIHLFRLNIAVGCLPSTYPSIHLFCLKIAVGCLPSTYPSIHFFAWENTQKITVGCPRCAYPSIRTKKRALTL